MSQNENINENKNLILLNNQETEKDGHKNNRIAKYKKPIEKKIKFTESKIYKDDNFEYKNLTFHRKHKKDLAKINHEGFELRQLGINLSSSWKLFMKFSSNKRSSLCFKRKIKK